MNVIKVLSMLLLSAQSISAFVTPAASINNAAFSKTASSAVSEMKMMDPTAALSMDIETLSTVVTTAPTMMLSETEPWVQPLSLVLGTSLNIFSVAMLCRVVISWYPKSNLNEFPYNIVVWPTEPLLSIIRGSVPPAFGVDITPIVWLGFFTFVNEILCGQQGLLTMKMKYGI